VTESDKGLLVQRLDDELLVYDTASDEAHCLSGRGAAEFDAAADDVSRREAIRRLAFAGAAAAGATLMTSIVAPTAAQAQSTACGTGGLVCTANQTCCGVALGTPDCCNNGAEFCLSGLLCNPCGAAGQACCPPVFGLCPSLAGGCCDGGVCVANGGACSQVGSACCNGVCCTPAEECNAGVCVNASDRDVKRDLEPVSPRNILTAL
jgi:hypothetical protein